jgi:hypothetical protein
LSRCPRADQETAAFPAINGRAYPIEDHTYDVVVVGAGGSGLRAVYEEPTLFKVD